MASIFRLLLQTNLQCIFAVALNHSSVGNFAQTFQSHERIVAGGIVSTAILQIVRTFNYYPIFKLYPDQKHSEFNSKERPKIFRFKTKKIIKKKPSILK